VLGFLVRRLGFGLLVLAGLSMASFCFFASLADTIPSGRPVLAEYWTWLKGVGTGDSLQLLTQPAPVVLNRQPTTMLAALGHTAALLALAFVLVVIFSVALALVAASRRGSVLDVVLRGLSYLAWGVPAFLLALLVQKVLSSLGSSAGIGPFRLAGWPGSCPAGLGINSGIFGNCPKAGSGLTYVGSVFRYITLPAATLAVGFVGLHARFLRSALFDTLDAPFVNVARGKGLTQQQLLRRHVLRVSLGTFTSALLTDFGAIFGAAMAVDWIFELNGLGTVLVNEFPIDNPSPVQTYSVQLVLLITGCLVIVSSLLGDLALRVLDPRTRSDL
jgi:ABC-type dipeptide/oligopeptide/nickel transport system permease component